MGKKSGNGKKVIKKGQFGISSEDTYELRRAMKAAAKQHGEQVVLDKLGVECLTAACESVTIDMTRSDFGRLRNAVKALEPKRVKVNKYAHLRQS